MTVPNDIYALLGKAVLLPVKRGEKRPIDAGWQALTFAQTQTPEYRARLEQGNVGVKLGADSDGLCAIDIDDDEAVEPFLRDNPGLRETLITKVRRHCRT